MHTDFELSCYTLAELQLPPADIHRVCPVCCWDEENKTAGAGNGTDTVIHTEMWLRGDAVLLLHKLFCGHIMQFVMWLVGETIFVYVILSGRLHQQDTETW